MDAVTSNSQPSSGAVKAVKAADELVVNVQGLNHYFGDGENRKQVLFNNTLQVGPGELVIMTGPSGSGKTTLLTLVGALRSSQEGSNRVLGKELNGLGAKQLNEVRRQIGFIFQMHNLFDSLTAFENVKMSMELHGHKSRDMRREIIKILSRLGLGERIYYKPRQLSGGQRQRVAVARALVNRPKLILADEPTAALDKKSSRDVVDMLKHLTREERATILMVTHDSRILDVADRIVNMVDGHIESDVSVNESLRLCEFLKKSSVFSNLSPNELMHIAEKMKREPHSAGERVIRQGDEGDKFYVITAGKLDVHINVDREGRETKWVDDMSNGDFFGEKALLTGEPRNASIITAEDSVLYSLGKEDFHAALKASDSFQDQLRKVAMGR